MKRHVNDPTSPTRLAIVSTEEGHGTGPARQIYGILRFDVCDQQRARLEITERGFLNLSKQEAHMLADALMQWCHE